MEVLHPHLHSTQWVEQSYLSTSLGENHESPGIFDNFSKLLPVCEGMSVYLALWDDRSMVASITCYILDISTQHHPGSSHPSLCHLPSQNQHRPPPHTGPLNFCLPSSLQGSELEIIVFLGCFLYTWVGGTEIDQPEQKGAHSVFFYSSTGLPCRASTIKVWNRLMTILTLTLHHQGWNESVWPKLETGMWQGPM